MTLGSQPLCPQSAPRVPKGPKDSVGCWGAAEDRPPNEAALGPKAGMARLPVWGGERAGVLLPAEAVVPP